VRPEEVKWSNYGIEWNIIDLVGHEEKGGDDPNITTNTRKSPIFILSTSKEGMLEESYKTGKRETLIPRKESQRSEVSSGINPERITNKPEFQITQRGQSGKKDGRVGCQNKNKGSVRHQRRYLSSSRAQTWTVWLKKQGGPEKVTKRDAGNIGGSGEASH